MNSEAVTRALTMIETSTDPERLRSIGVNARKLGEFDVARRADLKLYQVLPKEAPGTLEYDVWKSIHALEGTLTQEREKTTRLSRTRQKITAVGELETIKALVMKPKPSEGFHMLIEREMSELTFEAVVLRHPEQFDEIVLSAAKVRLIDAGILIA